MAKKLMFALEVVVCIALLAGCGYKAPPYYEKLTTGEGSTVAL